MSTEGMMLFKKNFSPAYVISNEDQRWATTVVPNVRKVLTVTGSGDQAIFYTLAGATIVDTFDMTYNARAIQDIKFAAIKKCSIQEYFKLLTDLFYAHNISTIPDMKKIMPMLPRETCEIIGHPWNTDMFQAGMDATYYPENILTHAEYMKLRKKLKNPFNFVQCDLYDLSAKISDTYDLINISNIFDYCYDAVTQANILRGLTDHLNIGGHIAYLPQRQQFDYSVVRLTSPNGAKLEYKTTKSNNASTPNRIDTKIILFQRTR